MDILTAATACALLVAAPTPCDSQVPIRPATANRIAQWDGFITEASRRFDVPDAWIRRVMALESAGNALWNGKPITSAKGAMGLMQIMPQTWADMRARLGLGRNPYDPHDNILAGAAYLHDMAARFGTGAFAAYNAGPGRYSAYLDGRETLPTETKSYLARLNFGDETPLESTSRNGLFVVNRAAELPSDFSQNVSGSSITMRGLFIPLSDPSR